MFVVSDGCLPLRILAKSAVFILIGETRFDLKALLEDRYSVCLAESLDKAVEHAAGNAKSGDIVLLSPACASFDMFDNYKKRGEAFKKLGYEHSENVYTKMVN